MQTSRTKQANAIARALMIELLAGETLDGDVLRKALLTLYRSGDMENADFYLIGYLGRATELRRRLIESGVWIGEEGF